jgi:hypothetical protein
MTKRIINIGVLSARKVLDKNPRLKKRIKRVLLTQLSNDVGDNYPKWLLENFPDPIKCASLKFEAKEFKYNPLISIIVPTYNTNIKFLRECFDSVLSQIYERWELTIYCGPMLYLRSLKL